MAEPSRYRPVFTDASVTFFAALSRRRQRKLLDRAHELARDPFLTPDFSTRDAEGRVVSHVLVDGFIFDFWVDHATKVVIIVGIDDAT